MKPIALLPAALLALTPIAQADIFGSGAGAFTIDFVTVGNPGNADDAGAGGSSLSSPYGGVGYTYRMGVYEIAYSQVQKAVNLGLANVSVGVEGEQPAVYASWYEAAIFVNWLNTSTGHQAAYNLSGGISLWSSPEAWQADGENLFRHKDAYYFLPNEDEWYKAAYHQNDGGTANYWDYPTGSNTEPNGIGFLGDPFFQAVFGAPFAKDTPNEVFNTGVPSPYGTYGQGGNVWEWMESAYDGANDYEYEYRTLRGGLWNYGAALLRADYRTYDGPFYENRVIGFRVASIPEPGSAALLAASAFPLLLRRRR